MVSKAQRQKKKNEAQRRRKEEQKKQNKVYIYETNKTIGIQF